MKHLSAMEKSAAALGIVAIITGLFVIVHPMEMMVSHPRMPSGAGAGSRDGSQYVSKRGSQIYGGLAVLMGIGMTWIGLHRKRR